MYYFTKVLGTQRTTSLGTFLLPRLLQHLAASVAQDALHLTEQKAELSPSPYPASSTLQNKSLWDFPEIIWNQIHTLFILM